jgi:actin-related protein
MPAIGLDMGTGFVKIVSDGKSLVIPSLYAYRDPGAWEKTDQRIIALGEEAKNLQKYPDAVVLRPVQEGRPVDMKSFEALVTYSVKKILEPCDPVANMSETRMVIGLPYSAKDDRQRVAKLVQSAINPKMVLVVPQAIGTLIDQDRQRGIVLSIGQGTSELVAFEDSSPVDGQSIPQASDFITGQFGEFAHLDFEVYSKNTAAVAKGVEKLSDILANRTLGFRSRLGSDYDIIVSGGGIKIPGMQEALARKIKKFVVPDDPVLSNAKGLHKLCVSVKC